MDAPQFPPNSEASKRQAEAPDKDIKRVTSKEATRRKKSLGKQFRETFIAGDARSSLEYMVFEVMIPAAKEMIAESFEGGVRQYFFGSGRNRRGGATPPITGPTGMVSYNQRYSMSRQAAPQRAISRMARAKHDFDEIVLDSRTEAENVIDQMFEVVSRYGEVSVADLYGMIGIKAEYTDNRWGWSDLRGAGVSRVRGGYLLDLPEPQPIQSA